MLVFVVILFSKLVSKRYSSYCLNKYNIREEGIESDFYLFNNFLYFYTVSDEENIMILCSTDSNIKYSKSGKNIDKVIGYEKRKNKSEQTKFKLSKINEINQSKYSEIQSIKRVNKEQVNKIRGKGLKSLTEIQEEIQKQSQIKNQTKSWLLIKKGETIIKIKHKLERDITDYERLLKFETKFFILVFNKKSQRINKLIDLKTVRVI